MNATVNRIIKTNFIKKNVQYVAIVGRHTAVIVRFELVSTSLIINHNYPYNTFNNSVFIKNITAKWNFSVLECALF